MQADQVSGSVSIKHISSVSNPLHSEPVNPGSHFYGS